LKLTGNIFISAVGQLNTPRIPNIDGLSEFEGFHFHSARWNHSTDFTDKSVAIIGTGPSAVQIIPELVKVVKKLTVFFRSPSYVLVAENKRVSPKMYTIFRFFPFLLTLYRWYLYLSFERLGFFMLSKDKFFAKKAKIVFQDMMKKEIKTEKLADMLIPKTDPLGCKRILFSSEYLEVLQRPNVEVVMEPILRVEKDGIRTSTNHYKVDGIVFATGFYSHNFLHPIDIQSPFCPEKSLSRFWNGIPRAYWGMNVPYFPNFFILYGPNTNLGHNSIIFVLECQITYVESCLRQMIESDLKYIDLKPEVLENYQKMIHEHMKETPFTSECRNWYKLEDGTVINNSPYLTIKYWWKTRKANLSSFFCVKNK